MASAPINSYMGVWHASDSIFWNVNHEMRAPESIEQPLMQLRLTTFTNKNHYIALSAEGDKIKVRE